MQGKSESTRVPTGSALEGGSNGGRVSPSCIRAACDECQGELAMRGGSESAGSCQWGKPRRPRQGSNGREANDGWGQRKPC